MSKRNPSSYTVVAMYGAPGMFDSPRFPEDEVKPDVSSVGTQPGAWPLSPVSVTVEKKLLRVAVMRDKDGNINIKISVDGEVVTETSTAGNSAAVEIKV